MSFPLLQETEIKRAAKRGDKQVRLRLWWACTLQSDFVCMIVCEQTAAVLAKQLVKLRQQRAKSHGLSSQITATGHQMKVGPSRHVCFTVFLADA